jgi:photosystem II stability/assembly factor-like uncharacterized protein
VKFIILCFLVIATTSAQIYKPGGYHISSESAGSADRQLGNAMVDMVSRDSLLWAGSGYGLNRTSDGGQSWTAFTSRDYISKGGITALTFMDDSTLWIATGFDTTVADGSNFDAGGGLSYTRDRGKTWTYIKQPVDEKDETAYKPTTTNILNITFDIAVLDSTIWITSWAGGLRKSDNMGKNWQVVTTDGLPFSALDYLNHRAFSVISENGNLWVGTADGISKSTDKGKTWRRFKHDNQELPISGNFVVALGYQEYTNTIWAATIETDSSDLRGVSKSENGGESWEVMLEGRFTHNFAFDGPFAYVATDSGMYVTNDGGDNWYILPRLYDFRTGEDLISDDYFSAVNTKESGATRLWVSNADGLASTIDQGNNWKIHRSFLSTRKNDTPTAYAYPSPFSPSRQDYIRFQYDITKSGEVVIDIYDFAMDHVASIREFESDPVDQTYDRNAMWDGKNFAGNVVASGVYFFRINVEGDITWGKFVVIN